MASSSVARVSVRIAFVLLLLLVGFYVGRPLYWKLSATIHDIRENKTTVKEGISQFVMEAGKSVGWIHDDESDLGVSHGKFGIATSRKLLYSFDAKPNW